LAGVYAAAAARYGPTAAHRGVGYSFLDYDAIAAHRLHLPVPGLRAYIGSTGHLICSQLCDQAYADVGAHLYADGRWPGYVTPLDLWNADQALRAHQLAAADELIALTEELGLYDDEREM
jgi:hypothetical protein